MTAVVDVVAALAALVLFAGVLAWLVREVRADGLGFTPPPRGTEDWSAMGLPSHPYGA
jgi:hypothetical protein